MYEDKKIKVKFKYEDEYNYLIQYIKRRKGDIIWKKIYISFFCDFIEKN